jgi:hypothetical protein
VRADLVSVGHRDRSRCHSDDQTSRSEPCHGLVYDHGKLLLQRGLQLPADVELLDQHHHHLLHTAVPVVVVIIFVSFIFIVILAVPLAPFYSLIHISGQLWGRSATSFQAAPEQGA